VWRQLSANDCKQIWKCLDVTNIGSNCYQVVESVCFSTLYIAYWPSGQRRRKLLPLAMRHCCQLLSTCLAHCITWSGWSCRWSKPWEMESLKCFSNCVNVRETLLQVVNYRNQLHEPRQITTPRPVAVVGRWMMWLCMVVGVQKEDVEPLAGYLSLHQSAEGLALKWTPNQLMNGSSQDDDATVDRRWRRYAHFNIAHEWHRHSMTVFVECARCRLYINGL